MGLMGENLTQIVIPVAALVGIVFALFQWFLVSKVRVIGSGLDGYKDRLIEEDEPEEGIDSEEAVAKCAEIQNAISVGATSFLFTQYKYLSIFTVVFGAIMFIFLGSVNGFSTKSEPCTYNQGNLCKPALANAIFTTIAFLLGALTSVLSGFLGMKIATYANARTTLEARKGVGTAFITAFRSGAVMGFLLAANGLLVLYVSINLFKLYYGDDWEGLYESITGYGLGGSSMALFGRVGGGIYTKAADVGADLVGKVERNIPEDDPRNPAVIADNVGDNVGDIAGMGSDLFGSYAESSCAALFVASISSIGISHNYTAMSYPLIISSMGIVVCLITTIFATDILKIKNVSEIEPSLKRQLLISTVLMTAGIAIVTFVALPSEFTLYDFGTEKLVKNWHLFLCVSIGLWAGLAIGYTTEYYTSNAYSPVQDVADSCRTGAATNVIFGLALGYKSVIIPIFAISIAIYVSFSLAAMYGIAVAALGMLSTIATGLAIDAYGPISDNAGGIAKMVGMSHKIRERTDALDAAGNTTAAIDKSSARRGRFLQDWCSDKCDIWFGVGIQICHYSHICYGESLFLLLPNYQFMHRQTILVKKTHLGDSSPVSSSPSTPCLNTVSNMLAVWYHSAKAFSLGKKPICKLLTMDIQQETKKPCKLWQKFFSQGKFAKENNKSLKY